MLRKLLNLVRPAVELVALLCGAGFIGLPVVVFAGLPLMLSPVFGAVILEVVG